MCGIGKTQEERKKLAREYFDIGKQALEKAFAQAPEILFITAAGNSNQNASFAEDAPADIVLPNLLTVGAVDKAGDEASFTSYGPTVKVHANGYQVESFLPGGDRVGVLRHLDGVAAGGEPRRQDPRSQPGADATAGDRHHRLDRRQDGRWPAHVGQPEEGARGGAAEEGLTGRVGSRRPL